MVRDLDLFHPAIGSKPRGYDAWRATCCLTLVKAPSSKPVQYFLDSSSDHVNAMPIPILVQTSVHNHRLPDRIDRFDARGIAKRCRLAHPIEAFQE